MLNFVCLSLHCMIIKFTFKIYAYLDSMFSSIQSEKLFNELLPNAKGITLIF